MHTNCYHPNPCPACLLPRLPTHPRLARQISVHIVVLAYVMVIVNALVLTPFILFGLGFAGRGMDWVHGAILAAMLAPTDAVAVTALLKAGGGPELIVTLMEGEALFNDASGVTLYVVFM